MEFEIHKTWDNKATGHSPVKIILDHQDDHIVMKIAAPFFNDPPAPEGEVGKPFNKLWDYEGILSSE